MTTKKKKLTPVERHQWIKEYLCKQMRTFPNASVDILDSDFVCAYIDATGATHQMMKYGAPKCPQLGRDLSAMEREYELRRHRTSINGMGGMGFPTWVWSYHL